MANRPTQRSMQDLLEKQLVSLQEIHTVVSASRVIELGQLIEEKKTLDDENDLLDETKHMNLGINAILESIIEIKEKFLSMPVVTSEDKSEQAAMNERIVNALETMADESKEEKPDHKQNIKEGLTLGPIIAGIGISLGALSGTIDAYVKNIKFWLKMLTPDLIKKKLMDAAEFIGKGISDFGTKLKEIFSEKLKGIGDIFESSIQKLKSVFVLDDESKIVQIFKWLKEGVKNFFRPFTEAYEMITDLLKSPTAKESDSIFKTIGESFGKFGKMFESVGKIFSKLLLPLNIIMTAWDVVKGAMEGYDQEGIIGGLQGAVTGLLNSVIGGLLDLVKDISSWVLEKLGFDQAAQELDSFSFQDQIADFLDAIFHPIDTIKKIISNIQISVIEGLNSLIETWNSKVPLDSLQISKLEVPDKYESTRVKPSERRKQKEAEDALLKKPVEQLTPVEVQKRAAVLVERGEDPTKDVKLVNRVNELSNNAEAIKPITADIVSVRTTETESEKEKLTSAGGSRTMISAPTVNTSNKTVNQQTIKLPTRNPDSTTSRYITSRYAV